MIELSVIRDFVAIFGVIAGLSYYVLVVRNQRENRKTQLFIQLHRDIATYEGWLNRTELLNMEWDDYEDFEKKYGSDNNPEAYAKRITHWTWRNNIGILLKEKQIDANMVFKALGIGIMWDWMKWAPVIMEIRERYTGPDWMEHFEYLAGEMARIRKQKGIAHELPETFLRYIPDQ